MTTPWRDVDPKRLARAYGAAAATGLVIYVLVIRLALPALVARLSAGQVDALRAAFATHPYAVMSGILVVAAVLALPVLIAFRLVYGPVRPAGIRRGRP
jgi:hypothetical protein